MLHLFSMTKTARKPSQSTLASLKFSQGVIPHYICITKIFRGYHAKLHWHH